MGIFEEIKYARIKELARESMLETLKTNLDSAMIFAYVNSLEVRINKAIEILEQENSHCPRSLTVEKSYIIEVEKINKVLSILRGEDNE